MTRATECWRLRQQGLSHKQIAAQLGITANSVGGYLADYRGRAAAEPDNESVQQRHKARRLFSDGVPKVEIARRLGVSHGRVTDYTAGMQEFRVIPRSTRLPEGDVPCAQTDPEIFYESQFRTMAARICADCPVQQACLERELHLEAENQWGFRGGKTQSERKRMIRAREAARRDEAAA